MRTGLFLLAGLLLLAALFVLARLFADHHPAAPSWATGAFLVVWLALATANLWTGVTRAGYSFGEELPILLLIFGVPAALALLVRWRLFP